MIYIVQGFTLGFSAGATPGPFHAYLLAQATRNGWRRAVRRWPRCSATGRSSRWCWPC